MCRDALVTHRVRVEQLDLNAVTQRWEHVYERQLLLPLRKVTVLHRGSTLEEKGTSCNFEIPTFLDFLLENNFRTCRFSKFPV